MIHHCINYAIDPPKLFLSPGNWLHNIFHFPSYCRDLQHANVLHIVWISNMQWPLIFQGALICNRLSYCIDLSYAFSFDILWATGMCFNCPNIYYYFMLFSNLHSTICFPAATMCASAQLAMSFSLPPSPSNSWLTLPLSHHQALLLYCWQPPHCPHLQSNTTSSTTSSI